MKAERQKKKRKKNSLALSASVIWASTVYHNAINLRSAPSSCVVMNWAMSLTPEQQRWVCQVNKQVQDVVKPCFQRQQQHCQLVPWDTFSSPQAVPICLLQRSLLCVSKTAFTHFHPTTWSVSMASSERIKQCLRDEAPLMLDGGLATELEARGVSLLVRKARGYQGEMGVRSE